MTWNLSASGFCTRGGSGGQRPVGRRSGGEVHGMVERHSGSSASPNGLKPGGSRACLQVGRLRRAAAAACACWCGGGGGGWFLTWVASTHSLA